MSVRLDRGDHITPLFRPPGLRSIINEKRRVKRKVRSSKSNQTSSSSITSFTINVEQMQPEKDEDENITQGVISSDGGFMQGAAALNAIILTIILLSIDTREQVKEECLAHWYMLNYENKTAVLSQIGTIRCTTATILVNIIVCIAPFYIAYAVQKENQATQRTNKNIIIVCVLGVLLSIRLGHTAVVSAVMQLCVIILMMLWSTNNTLMPMVVMCVYIALTTTQEALMDAGRRDSSSSVSGAMVVWWIIGISVVMNKYVATVRKASSIIMLLELCMVWLLVVDCL